MDLVVISKICLERLIEILRILDSEGVRVIDEEKKIIDCLSNEA